MVIAFFLFSAKKSIDTRKRLWCFLILIAFESQTNNYIGSIGIENAADLSESNQTLSTVCDL